MRNEINVRSLSANDRSSYIEILSDILLDCVSGGASVGFMSTLSRQRALAFWDDTFDSVAQRERVLFIAECPDRRPVGTVQIVTSQPDNQTHRADISKLLVHRESRGRGVARRLMEEVDIVSAKLGKSLLVLDTATGSDAESMYIKLGWNQSGIIPNFSMLPNGELQGTTLFWKSV